MIEQVNDYTAQKHGRATIYQTANLERLARELQRVLVDGMDRFLHLKHCAATVSAALSISRSVTDDGVIYVGRSWSTARALRYFAGMGYVFCPRDAFQAVTRLENTFMIDRRRMKWHCDDAGNRRRARGACPLRQRVEGRKRPGNFPPRWGPYLMGDGRYPLGYQRSS
jgi:hypothetical protein